MIDEDGAISSVTEKSAAQFSYALRSLHPAGCLCIKAPEALQLPILSFRQNLDAHFLGHIDDAIGWLVPFPRLQGLPVVAKASSPVGLSGEQS